MIASVATITRYLLCLVRSWDKPGIRPYRDSCHYLNSQSPVYPRNSGNVCKRICVLYVIRIRANHQLINLAYIQLSMPISSGTFYSFLFDELNQVIRRLTEYHTSETRTDTSRSKVRHTLASLIQVLQRPNQLRLERQRRQTTK